MDQPRNCSLTKEKIQNKKSIFFFAIANGASKEFVKFIFNEPEKEHGPFIIQYIGNYEISQAHGNAKTQLDDL